MVVVDEHDVERTCPPRARGTRFGGGKRTEIADRRPGDAPSAEQCTREDRMLEIALASPEQEQT